MCIFVQSRIWEDPKPCRSTCILARIARWCRSAQEVLATGEVTPALVICWWGCGMGLTFSLPPYWGARANGLSSTGTIGRSSQLSPEHQFRPEPVTSALCAGPLPTPETACIKILSLPAMQIVPCDNEVAREETGPGGNSKSQAFHSSRVPNLPF
jgi:hypothetical protein